MQNGYALCSNKWALDKDIKNELGLLIIISSLTAEKGYCYASNKFLAELFNIDETNISKKIKKLEKKNYIAIEYLKKGNVTYMRKIRLAKIPTTVGKNTNGDIIINNNIKNITSNNKRKIYKKKVIPDWFYQDIPTSEYLDTGFNTFIEEFRNNEMVK